MSQGMGFETVLYIIDSYSSFYMNLNMNYTAFSRAKTKLYLIGDIIAFDTKEFQKKKNSLIEFFKNENMQNKICDETKNDTDIKILDDKILDDKIPDDITHIDKDIGKKNRKKIPQQLRIDLWDRYFGFSSYYGNCYVNKNHKLNRDIFECGHVVSVCDGGDNNINNLRVICRGCNASMGTQNLENYKKTNYG